MAVDESQKHWNKENIPLGEETEACCRTQVTTQTIKRETTRRVLAELSLKDSDESDDSEGMEDNEHVQNCIASRYLVPCQSDGIYWAHFPNEYLRIYGACGNSLFCSVCQNSNAIHYPMGCYPYTMLNVHQTEDINTDKLLEELAKLCSWYQRSVDGSSRRKGKKILDEGCDDAMESCEDFEGFITPPLSSVPGIELEKCVSGSLPINELLRHKKRCPRGCRRFSGNRKIQEFILPKTSVLPNPSVV